MPAGDKLINVIKKTATMANPSTSKTDVVYGVVQNTSPLTVLVDNHLTLTAEFLILSPFCHKTAFTVQFADHAHGITVDTISIQDHTHANGSISVNGHNHTVDGKTTSEAGSQNIAIGNTLPSGGFSVTPRAHCQNAGAHKFTVTLWEDLKVGDKLVMLRVAEGQAYMILYRDRLSIKVT